MSANLPQKWFGHLNLEHPVVFSVALMLPGLLVAFFVTQFESPLPWYGWVAAAMLFPACSLVVVLLIGLVQSHGRQRKPEINREQYRQQRETSLREAVNLMRSNPIPLNAPRLTREDLHARR